MRRELPRRAGAYQSLVLWMPLVMLLAMAPAAALNGPPNACLDSSEDRCGPDPSDQTVDLSCVAVKVPESSYVDSSGDRWKCEYVHGYRKSDASCVAIEVPQTGYQDWTCDPAYRWQAESCAANEV